MKRQVKKWGGSLCIVLGKYFCEEEKIIEGDMVEGNLKKIKRKPKRKK